MRTVQGICAVTLCGLDIADSRLFALVGAALVAVIVGVWAVGAMR